jgi:cell cycle checkpoint protein
MRQRLLILKGPAGAGKTLTVQLIAKEMGINIIEWQNPTSSISGKDGFVSFGAQLEEFLGRGGQYAALDLFEEGAAVPRSAEQNGPSQTAKNLMLIEEFPNTFTRSSTALHSFRSAILQYLAANMPSLHSYGLNRSNTTVTPLILIISETLLTTTSANADSFTAHRLLGQEILQHPGASVIEFNRIAPTLLQKALDLVLLKESRRSGRKKIPGPGVLKQLCESGDVRSAVGSLEFLCLHGDNADWSSKVTFGKTKRVAKAAPMTDMEKGSLELITRREASLGIFHAVGKVVYNRRDDDSKEPLASENLAAHLTGKERPMKSKVEVDGLIDEIGTDTTTFLAALHENYLPSCDAPSPSDERSLNHAISCIEALSDADLLSPSWDGSFNPGGFGGGTGGRASGGDVMRQDEIAFQTAVRGILFALPFPVKRKAPEGQSNASRRGFSADANKMFYPTSLKLWRRKEEIESLVDLSVMNMLRGDFAITQVNPLSSEDTMANTSIVLGTGTGVKTEILLDRLPYLLQVVRAKTVTPVRGGVKPTTIPIKIQDLEKVVKFTGIGRIGLHGNDEEEDSPPLEGNTGDQWATDQLGDSPKRRIKPEGVKVLNGLESRLAASTIGNSTVLSDDDIEDFD